MARNKPLGMKLRMGAFLKSNRRPPAWVILKKFGLQRARHVSVYRIRHERRHWRRDWLKV